MKRSAGRTSPDAKSILHFPNAPVGRRLESLKWRVLQDVGGPPTIEILAALSPNSLRSGTASKISPISAATASPAWEAEIKPMSSLSAVLKEIMF